MSEIMADGRLVHEAVKAIEQGYVTAEEFGRLLDRVDELEKQVHDLQQKIDPEDNLSDSERAFHEQRSTWIRKSRERDRHRRGRAEE